MSAHETPQSDPATTPEAPWKVGKTDVPWIEIEDAQGRRFATVWYPAEADTAHLIASAPELLAALKRADAYLDHMRNSFDVCSRTKALMLQVKVAIGKAEPL